MLQIRLLAVAPFLLCLALITDGAFANPAKQTLHLPSPAQLTKASHADRMEYFRTLHRLIVLLDSASNPVERSRSALNSILFPDAFAQATRPAPPEEGDPCIPGGYALTWKKSGNNLTCSPSAEKDFVGAKSTTFACGKDAQGENRAFCNPAVFLYSNENRDSFCVRVKGFTRNCANAFEERYKDSPEDLEKAVQDLVNNVKDPAVLKQYYEQYAKFIKEMADDDRYKNNSQIPVIQAQLRKLDDVTKKVIASTIRDRRQQAETKRNPPKPPPRPADPEPKVELPRGTPVPSNACPAKPEPKPEPARATASKLLGAELTCIRDGLSSQGHKPSERFIALLAAGVQAYEGPFRTNDPESLKALRTRVISYIQAYGFCDEASYPTIESGEDLTNARLFITANNGATETRGLEYLTRASEDKKTAADQLARVFGINRATTPKILGWSTSTLQAPAIFEQLFSADQKKWKSLAAFERQDQLRNLSPVANSGTGADFGKCLENAKARMQSDRAFDSHQAKVIGTVPRTTDSHKKAMEAMEANKGVCSTLADACQLNAEVACGDEYKRPSRTEPQRGSPATGTAGSEK